MLNVNSAIPALGLGSSLSNSNLSFNSTHQSHSQFREQQLIVKFCQSTELAKVFRCAVNLFLSDYRKTRKPEEALAPLRLRLDFECTQLLTHAPELLHFAVEEPLQFAEAVKYASYGQVRDLLKASANDSDPKSIDIAQVHTQWRLQELPLKRNFLFDPGQNLYPLGLALVHGILSAYTPPETLVLQSTWYCGGCMRNAIQTSSTDAPLCPNCSRPMNEYQKLRVAENYRIAAILSGASVQTPRTVDRIHRPVLVRLRAHTYDCELILGAVYLITGYYSGTANYQFEACYLKKIPRTDAYGLNPFN